ncbi:17929_t:CDS:2 [Gigaspora margarita]|uniref:17929_t:CDS:1 n=1 Tax=Gigaspora margarita TaxID=4874 RepID=A0ABN7UQJ0_GIGMA|nr:17929_t:CDS:2 [Gigaspora margarita]
MNSNKKQKVVKSNTKYSQSQESTKFSNNKNIETISDNKESKSDTSKSSFQNFKSIPDGYRSLSKTSASKLGKVIQNCQKQTCNTICNTDRSTGNIWDHLSSIHGITKDSNLKSKDQPKISIMFKTSATNLKCQTKQNQFLVEWIIDNVQALRVVESEKFKAFIVNLDSYYKLSTRDDHVSNGAN